MSAVTLVRPSLGRRSSRLVRTTLGKRAITLVRPSLGNLGDIDRATRINNNYQLLWRNATRKQQVELLDPVMREWIFFYNRYKDSMFVRATEFNKLDAFEQRYAELREEIKRQGTIVTAPEAVPSQLIPQIPEKIKVEVDPGDTPEQIRQKAEQASEKFVADFQAMLIRVALWGGAILVAGAGVLWLVNRSKKGTATAGMEKVNVKHLTPAESRKRIKELRRKGCRVQTERLPDGSLLVLKTCPKGVSGLGMAPQKHLVQAEHRLLDFERMIEMFGRHVQTKNCTMASRYLSEAYEARGKTDAHASSTIFDKNATDNEIREAEDILRRDSKMNERLSRLRTRFEIDCLE